MAIHKMKRPLEKIVEDGEIKLRLSGDEQKWMNDDLEDNSLLPEVDQGKQVFDGATNSDHSSQVSSVPEYKLINGKYRIIEPKTVEDGLYRFHIEEVKRINGKFGADNRIQLRLSLSGSGLGSSVRQIYSVYFENNSSKWTSFLSCFVSYIHSSPLDLRDLEGAQGIAKVTYALSKSGFSNEVLDVIRVELPTASDEDEGV